MKEKTTIRKSPLALAVFLAVSAASLKANEAHVHGTAPAAEARDFLAEGEIRKVDRSAGKLTIRHGPLENLGMGAMTMVFRVKDPSMLEQVKSGDKVRFHAERADGVLTVTRIEPLR
jgi:Cu/Ag efflux protein CusF